jgi:threonine dehydratase
MSHPIDKTTSPAKAVRATTWIEAPRLAKSLGVNLMLASETFQFTGSFKFRAAYNLASKVPQPQLLTASSGNFGQALAYACWLLGKTCTVVMPHTSAQVKVEGVREYGGVVELVDVRATSRATRVAELSQANPGAYVASPYDDPLVIEGNASLGLEIATHPKRFDAVVAPVGGGGLTAGLIRGMEQSGRTIPLVGVEPVLANDAARSLRLGRLVTNEAEPQTLADGVRTISLGQHNWVILRERLSGIVEVEEKTIAEAVRLLFSLANLKAEPTGALSIAALLSRPDLFEGKTICCVITGGNVDPALFASMVAGE